MKLSKIYKNWPVHNILGHPLMQVLNWLGLHVAASMVHDGTLPLNESTKLEEIGK